jgi:1-aminocyclopropane-1-carboxylate deaminase/D-cysteine desulfhydrase-like pyridoxal-dependent ACC family enzyme
MEITREYLQNNPNHIFVFGDNAKKVGTGGAAKFRDMPNTYGFVTKKYPCNHNWCFYSVDEYLPVYKYEVIRLITEIENNPDKIYLISKIGSGLANKFRIFENVIELSIKSDLAQYTNVVFLW